MQAAGLSINEAVKGKSIQSNGAPLHRTRTLMQPAVDRSASAAVDVRSPLLATDDDTEEDVRSQALVNGSGSGSRAMAGVRGNGYAFTAVLGDRLPFVPPNVRSDNEQEDLEYIINGAHNHHQNVIDPSQPRPVGAAQEAAESAGSCGRYVAAALVGATGVGLIYLGCSQYLIQQDEYGFSSHNGKIKILLPGRHLLLSPINFFEKRVRASQQHIQVGPVNIIRVPQGHFGLALANTRCQILLPGVHCRVDPTFVFQRHLPMDADLSADFGPIKVLTVRSGTARVCYLAGKVHVLKEGRYAVNDGTFAVASIINIQQQNLRFEKHMVLLDGGITMMVEGLLTYQVKDVELLIHQLGERDLVRAIQDVTKAELSRVFACIHLEEISSSANPSDIGADGSGAAAAPAAASGSDERKYPAMANPSGLLGAGLAASGASAPGSREGETRTRICAAVMESVRHTAEAWGLEIKNFQLESTKIADDKYAAEYESASLAMAKAKADLRAVVSQNKIKIQKAKADADALQIQAEARKKALITQAEGEAAARKIDATSRNEAGDIMANPFSQALAMANQSVDMCSALKATHLTVVPSSVIGRAFQAQQGQNVFGVDHNDQ